MKPAVKILTCFVLTIAFGLTTNSFTVESQATTTIAVCDCGNPKCGGCQRGKIISAMRSNRIAGCSSGTCGTTGSTASSCGCQDCGQATTFAPAPAVIIEQPYMVESFTPMAVTGCGGQCGGGCRSCKLRRPIRQPRQKCVNCPQCNSDQCELKTEKGESKKSCFKVEQKEVCIPAVTLPWKKHCPKTTSKMRVVNVLKKHSYKCPSCEYSWEVMEPEAASEPVMTESAPIYSNPTTTSDPMTISDPTTVEGEISTPSTPTAPTSAQAAEPVQTGLDVPQPPLEPEASK